MDYKEKRARVASALADAKQYYEKNLDGYVIYHKLLDKYHPELSYKLISNIMAKADMERG